MRNPLETEMRPSLNQELVVRVSPVWRRCAALLIDFLVICICAACLWVSGTGFPSAIPVAQYGVLDHLVSILLHQSRALGLGIGYTLLIMLPLHSVFQARLGGTLGETLLRVKLVVRSGRPPTLMHALLRSVTQVILSALLGLGLLWLLVDPSRQTLGDRLCGTWLICRT